MLLRGKVDLPDEVLEAQGSKRLVIFAGAGVSIPYPSGLPSFKDLANKVAAECGRNERVEDPSRIEEFLGKLHEEGASVHETVKRIISDPSSQANQLHKLVVQLFESESSLRIVTSNFDMHFEDASKDLFGQRAHMYRAPALPLGNDFEGIVKLHGSIDDAARKLVVTDADFGRAYLTEAWATRFLISLYQEFTVLFVGYSHDDTVMKYLARGLPGRLGGTRFALTPEDQREKWRALGVTAIPYPPHEVDPHLNLVTALQSWARISRMGVLQHERQIREITSTPPPSDPELADYVTLILKDEVTTRFFVNHAKSIAWLRWVEEKGFLKPLFVPHSELSGADTLIASWFAMEFSCESPEAALGVVHRAEGTFHPFLWHQIAHRVWTRNPRPAREIVGRWVSLLLQTAPSRGSDYLGYLLQKCAEDGLSDTSLLLFQYLISPVVELRPYLGFLDDEESLQEVTPEITFPGEHYALNEAWTNVFRPRLSQFASRLVPILTEVLSRTRTLQLAWSPGDRAWDGLSFSRAAIEPHNQDGYPQAIDIIIDAARDTLEYILGQQPHEAESLIDSWARSGTPLLQRLAVHGVTEFSSLTANERLAFVKVSGWLYQRRLKHEIFRLLAENFQKADLVWQQRILDEAEKGPQGEEAERLPKDVTDYVRYNLLVWLKAIAPDSGIAQDAFARVQETHPEFAPQEHPDLDFYHGEFELVSSPSPLSVEELLRVEPSDEGRLQFLLNYMPGEGATGWEDRSGLLGNVSAAAREQFSWGERLALALAEESEWASDLWRALISSWSDQSLAEEQWSRALDLMSNHDGLGDHAAETATWLEHALTSSPGIPETQLDKVEGLLSKTWAASEESEPATEDESDDWLTMAINRTEGRIVLAMIQALSRRRKSAQDWTGLPPFYREALETVVHADPPRGRAGRIVLASQVHFLFALDQAWTTDHVVPLFDWERDAATSEQAWHGYVGWGRLNEAVIRLLLPFYEQTFEHLQQLKRFRQRFISHLSIIAVVDPSNPLEHDWLRKFLASADEEDRGTLSGDIADQLRSLNENAIKQAWDEWLRDYVELRLGNIPVPMGGSEAAELGEWPLALRPVFREAAGLVVALPSHGKPYTRFFEEIATEDDVWLDADIALRLVVHRMKGFVSPFWQCSEAADAVRKAHGAHASNGLLHEACDELARLGCPEASQLRDSLLP